MQTRTFQVRRWVIFFLLITPIWIAIPACTSNEARVQVEEDSTEARTIKSRRKQRLRQQRCEQEAAKLQAVQSKLAIERSPHTSKSQIVQDLAEQEKKLTAAIQQCQ